ncbi:MAG: CoA-binding protein [Bacteroidota bacterium]|nr:CoA-binding protein [Bacteroidota bacterium]
METIPSVAKEFLSQQRLAVVGISSSKQTVANGVYKKLKNGTRTVYAVGKNTSTFENDTCYPNLASLPSPVDGVFIAVKNDNTEQVVDECIALHIPRVWMHDMSGITKMSGAATPRGSSVSVQAVQKCREHNIAVIPGACPMMFLDDADFGHKCFKWFLSITGKLKV